MSKRVFLIHGWQGHPNEGWRPWLKNELEKRGFKIFVPAMLDTDNPKMEDWVGHLVKTVGKPDGNCYFVGHSLGCITILRYLETLKENEKVGGCILVAGFSDSLGYRELENFFEKPIDWNKIRSHCENFVAIHSDNDPYVPLKYGDVFKEKVNAKVIIEHGMKHFSSSDGITELPVVLESLLEISG